MFFCQQVVAQDRRKATGICVQASSRLQTVVLQVVTVHMNLKGVLCYYASPFDRLALAGGWMVAGLASSAFASVLELHLETPRRS